MAAVIEKGMFIEVEYTGKTKEEGSVFDTTSQSVAEQAGLEVRKKLKPAVICAGEGHLLPGLDEQLLGKPLGEHSFLISAEKGFGKKSAKLLQLIPRKVFKEQGVQPVPGLEITVDEQVGVIKTASGGRVIVDFNHPLSGKELVYDVVVKRFVTDKEEQLKGLLDVMRVPYNELSVTGEHASIISPVSPPETFITHFAKDVVRLTGIKDVVFKKPEEQGKEGPQDKQGAGLRDDKKQ